MGQVLGGGPQHKMHPGKGAQVLQHANVSVYARDMEHNGDPDLSSDDEPNPPARVPNRPSLDNHIATLSTGELPCASVAI